MQPNDITQVDLIIEYLKNLSENEFERQQRHLKLRDAHTSYLTENAPDTFSWASSRIAFHLKQLQDVKKVLDLGCGNGTYLSKLVPQYAKSGVGLDIRREALQAANLSNPTNISYVQGNALSLPFPNSAFAAAMANRMLNQTGDIATVLKELYRVMLSKGLLFVLTADRRTPPLLRDLHETCLQKLGFPTHLYAHTTDPRQRLNYENGTQWLQEAGFKSIVLEDYQRTLTFENLYDVAEYYSTGLIFQKSGGFREPNVLPNDWAKLYLLVRQELAGILANNGLIEICEGAILFISQKP